jgi:hypothetical protein
VIAPKSFCDLHRALLPDHPQQGIRDRQNWIGGSDRHPIAADFVPPPPESVPHLIEDLADYLTGGVHGPLLQAADVSGPAARAALDELSEARILSRKTIAEPPLTWRGNLRLGDGSRAAPGEHTREAGSSQLTPAVPRSAQ